MKHKNFFIVPNQIFELGLKPKEFAVYTVQIADQSYTSFEEQRSRQMPTDLFAADTESIWAKLNALRTPSEQRFLTKSSLKKFERSPTTLARKLVTLSAL